MKITYFASKSKLFYLSKLFIIKCLKMQFKMFGVFFFLLSCLLCVIITMVQALTIEPYVCLNDS